MRKNPTALETLRNRMAEYDNVDGEIDNEEDELEANDESMGDMGAIVWPSIAEKTVKASGPATGANQGADKKKSQPPARFIDLNALVDGEVGLAG